MRIQDSQPGSEVIEARPFFARLYHFLPDWLVLNGLTSVRQKIGWGYAIVVGATLASTTVGIQLDRANRREAHARTVAVTTQQLQVQRLQNQMLRVQGLTAELLGQTKRGEISPETHERVRLYLATCLRLLEDLQPQDLQDEESQLRTLPLFGADDRGGGRSGDSAASSGRSAIAADPRPSFPTRDLRDYRRSIVRYTSQLEAILTVPDAGRADSTDTLERELSDFLLTSEYLAFRELAYALSSFSAELEDLQVWLQDDLERSEQLSQRIWLIGICLAVLLTAVAIFYISGIISYPLSFATAFAQRITQESNYRLQIPKISNDEVGTLTEAIDTLVRQVEADRTEIKDAQAQLVQVEKMSGLGQVVAGVAHEINNPVNFIYGNLAHLDNSVQDLTEIIELYRQTYPDPSTELTELLEEVEFDYLREDIPKQIASMRMGAERIRQIVLSLRVFSRLDEASSKQVDLHSGIDSTLALLDHRLQGGVHLVRQYGNVPQIDCYPAQLNQVWMNVFSNALDALEMVAGRFDATLSKPTLAIETHANERQVTIKIRDNGIGIPEDVLDRIFDPFFTTKPVGKGTGLGLSVSFAIVERHGGQLKARSQPDFGTEVCVILPLSRKEKIGLQPAERFR